MRAKYDTCVKHVCTFYTCLLLCKNHEHYDSFHRKCWKICDHWRFSSSDRNPPEQENIDERRANESAKWTSANLADCLAKAEIAYFAKASCSVISYSVSLSWLLPVPLFFARTWFWHYGSSECFRCRRNQTWTTDRFADVHLADSFALRSSIFSCSGGFLSDEEKRQWSNMWICQSFWTPTCVNTLRKEVFLTVFIPGVGTGEIVLTYCSSCALNSWWSRRGAVPTSLFHLSRLCARAWVSANGAPVHSSMLTVQSFFFFFFFFFH